MMVKIMVYAYATGCFSSRKIARKLHEDVAFRVLAADKFPAAPYIFPMIDSGHEIMVGLLCPFVQKPIQILLPPDLE